MAKTRAAVVLFVDVDEEDCPESRDVAILVNWALHQAGIDISHPLQWKRTTNDTLKTVDLRIVSVMDAGMAAGNGYLWTATTSKAFSERGIYTEAQQAQIDAEKEWENEDTAV